LRIRSHASCWQRRRRERNSGKRTTKCASCGARGDVIGRVHDLIVEMDTRQARNIDVAASTDAKGDSRQRASLLIPIGLARLVDDSNVVSIGALTGDELLSLPAYEHKPFTRQGA